MLPYILTEKVKEITESDYALEQWRLNDLIDLLTPAIIERYIYENGDVLVQASYDEGFDAGRDYERDEMQDAIYELKRLGWDKETLEEVLAII
jgi:PHD/YefM family antitoxin component YafN of YafNO toxin-antitoxin module